MSEAIGIRLEKDFLKKIESLRKDELSDRSSTLRKLLYVGYSHVIKERVAEEYKKGSITLSEAAQKAGITLFEMEQFLVQNGFVSNYSIDDLRRELALLK